MTARTIGESPFGVLSKRLDLLMGHRRTRRVLWCPIRLPFGASNPPESVLHFRIGSNNIQGPSQVHLPRRIVRLSTRFPWASPYSALRKVTSR